MTGPVTCNPALMTVVSKYKNKGKKMNVVVDKFCNEHTEQLSCGVRTALLKWIEMAGIVADICNM